MLMIGSVNIIQAFGGRRDVGEFERNFSSGMNI